MPSCNTTILLGFLLPWHGVSLHGCFSKAQPLFLTLDEGYLLTAAVPDLQRGIAPLGHPVPAQPSLLGLPLPAAAPGLGLEVAPQGHCPWPRARGGFSRPPLTLDVGCLLPAATGLGRWVAPPRRRPDLGRGMAPPGRSCAVAAWHSWPLSLTLDVGWFSAALSAPARCRL